MSGIIWTVISGFSAGLLARALKPGDDKLSYIMTAVLGIAGSFMVNLIGQSLGWYKPGEKRRLRGFGGGSGAVVGDLWFRQGKIGGHGQGLNAAAPARRASCADQPMFGFLVRTLVLAKGVDTMHPGRSMFNTGRQIVPAMCCCLWAGLPAPQAWAQARIAGSLTQGGPFIGAPAWSVRGGAARSGFATHRWVCHPGWGACLGGSELRLMLERQHRFDALRNAAPADQGPVERGLWRVPPHAYLPPPTPLDQIVPAYRDRSVLRPEFQSSGKPLD